MTDNTDITDMMRGVKPKHIMKGYRILVDYGDLPDPNDSESKAEAAVADVIEAARKVANQAYLGKAAQELWKSFARLDELENKSG